ncbi:hypothetical protein NNRS527_00439 [Nitrosospira sp. NRS527]|nr:hypothetical protein NNRS527_00439 [Nitrosospira sp. NRS527]
MKYYACLSNLNASRPNWQPYVHKFCAITAMNNQRMRRLDRERSIQVPTIECLMHSCFLT